MSDEMLWSYLEALPELETAWFEWYSHLAGWHCFNTFYNHYLRVENKRAKLFNCNDLCDYKCPRLVIEDSQSNITAVCPLEDAVPIKLKLRDILVYSLRRDVLHKAICTVMQIESPSGNNWPEFGSTWYLGDYSNMAVYITYRTDTGILLNTISSLYLLHQFRFILMIPTAKNITPEIQQFIDKNKIGLLSMADELILQPNGTFKSICGIPQSITQSNQRCPQTGHAATYRGRKNL